MLEDQSPQGYERPHEKLSDQAVSRALKDLLQAKGRHEIEDVFAQKQALLLSDDALRLLNEQMSEKRTNEGLTDYNDKLVPLFSFLMYARLFGVEQALNEYNKYLESIPDPVIKTEEEEDFAEERVELLDADFDLSSDGHMTDRLALYMRLLLSRHLLDQEQFEADLYAVHPLLIAFVNAAATTKSWGETLAILEREQILLLTDVAEATLLLMISDEARKDRDELLTLMDHFRLLHEARIYGIPSAQWMFTIRELRERLLAVHREGQDQALEAELQCRLGRALQENSTGDRSANLEEARASYQEAMRIYTFNAFPEQYAQVQLSLGDLYLERLEGEKQANAQLAIKCYKEVLRVYRPDTFPEEYALTLVKLADAYLNCLSKEFLAYLNLVIAYEGRIPAFFSEEERFYQEEMIWCLQAALQVYEHGEYLENYATVQAKLGYAYFGRINGKFTENVEKAIACYHGALRIFQRRSFPDQYAEIQYLLGSTYLQRVEGEQRINIEKAIYSFREAVQLYGKEAFPRKYQAIQLMLGVAYRRRIEGERRSNIEEGIACYREALQVSDPDDPLIDQTGKILVNLGVAYATRIEGERRANLEQAIRFYEEALQIYPLEASPVEYALIQNNLGEIYRRRIEGETRTNIEKAITCYYEALRVRTLEELPLDYAATQDNLGLAYFDRIEGQRSENLEAAISCYQEAIRVRTIDTSRYGFARTHSNLGAVYLQREKGERLANLQAATESFQNAVQVWTKETFPDEWASIQRDLGLAYQYRSEEEHLERAIACFHNALQIYTFEAFPEDYAKTQNNLGAVYWRQVSGGRRSETERAIGCFREALWVYTLEAYPFNHYHTAINLATAEMERGNWEEAHEAYHSALAAEDLLFAMGSGIVGKDVVLKENRRAAAHDGFALAKSGRIAEAAVAIERGRARELAEALEIDIADPALIRNVDLRKRYESARRNLIEALFRLNNTTEAINGLKGAAEESGADTSEQIARKANLERIDMYRKAKSEFDAVVADIRQARDPEHFLEMALDSSMILQAAEQGGPGAALVYIVATPHGGLAVAALSTHQADQTTARFAQLELTGLTEDIVADLIKHRPEGDVRLPHTCGFSWAQDGSGLGLILRDWPGETFREKATALHAMCVGRQEESTLDRAAQTIIALPAFEQIVDQPLAELLNGSQNNELITLDTFNETLNHHFLSYELARCMPLLADILMRPLVNWLLEQGVTSVTLIVSGLLAIFPLAAAEVWPGQMMGDLLPTSFAPNARVLLLNERRAKQRSGVYTIGDPRPTHQELRWGEAEAYTLVELAHRLGLPGEARVRDQATRAWLIDALQKGAVIDACCHGAFGFKEPLQSHLMLAQGETLLLGEMLSHHIDLQELRLLILSACQTAIIDTVGAYDEVHSLAVGMLQSGARAVLAAQWSVDDKATYLLMVRFAQEWLPRLDLEPPTAALARAQRWLRTVTNHDLQLWSARTLPTLTAEQQGKVGEITEGLAQEQSETEGLVVVRGRGSRYGAGAAERLVQTLAGRLPSDFPYVDPIYWAGFQVIGR